jgi:hypothetical protein
VACRCLEAASRGCNNDWLVTSGDEIIGYPDHGVHDSVDSWEKGFGDQCDPHALTMHRQIEQSTSRTGLSGERHATIRILLVWG